jgi:iron(III) transport system permease protein
MHSLGVPVDASLRRLTGRRRVEVARRAPLALLALGLVVAALAMLPLAYLVLRAAGAQAEGLAFVLRPRTLEVVGSTIALAVLVGGGSVLIGVPVAWLTTRARLPGRRVWAILTVVPLAIPSYVTGFAFVAAFGPRGALQSLLEPLGVARLPEIYGLPGAVLVLVLATYPYVVLSARAGLLGEDRALEDAARTLGDDRRSTFRRLTVPLLLPAIAAGALLAVLYAVSDFGAVSLLQFDSLSRAIYVQYRAAFDRSLAAVLALFLVAITLLLSWGEARVRARARTFTARPPRRPVEPVELGRWTWPSQAFLGGVVTLALVVPAGTIAFWLVRGLGQGLSVDVLRAAGVESFVVGAGSAIGAAALALPLGILLARHRSWVGDLVERSTYVAFALPGIVLALALVFLGTSLVPALYQTLFLLLAAYAVRFLPQVLGGVRAALMRIGPRPEEAARTLGRSSRTGVRPGYPAHPAADPARGRRARLPDRRQGAADGARPRPDRVPDPGDADLGAASEGFYADAAVPAAVLLVLSAATVTLLLRDERSAR